MAQAVLRMRISGHRYRPRLSALLWSLCASSLRIEPGILVGTGDDGGRHLSPIPSSSFPAKDGNPRSWFPSHVSQSWPLHQCSWLSPGALLANDDAHGSSEVPPQPNAECTMARLTTSTGMTGNGFDPERKILTIPFSRRTRQPVSNSAIPTQ